MDRGGKGIRWERRSAPPVVVGERRLTTEAWVLHGTWPGGGFVWNRPVAVIVEQDGQRQRLPIVNVTRWAELVLWGLAALLLLATMRSMTSTEGAR